MLAGIFLAGRADVVFAPSSPPLTNGICGWLISRLKRCSVAYSIQDMYPDMAEKADIIRSVKLLRFLKWLETAVYRLSDRVLLLSEEMRRCVISKGVEPDKTHVIANFFDTQFMKPQPGPNEFSKEWGLDGKFVVMYGGNVGIPHGADVILEAAEVLAPHDDIVFCFVGRGEYKPKLERIVSEKGLGNVRFIPVQPFERMPQIWSAAAVSLITYKRGLSSDSLPTKLIASMCCERPTIGTVDDDSDTYRLIHRANCGITVEPEDPAALAEAVLTLYRDPSRASTLGHNGRAYSVAHFDRNVISRKYETFFGSMTT